MDHFNLESWELTNDYQIKQTLDDDTINNIFLDKKQLVKYPLYFLEFMLDNNICKCLSLIDVLMLTGLSKRMAYTAYTANSKGFQKFCDKTWILKL